MRLRRPTPRTFKRRKPRRRTLAIAASLAGAGVLLGGWGLWRALLDRPPPPRPARRPAVLLPAGRPEREVTFAEGCMTAECHAPLAAARAVHPTTSLGACDACHAADAGGHTYPLRLAREALCADCHGTAHHATADHPALGADGCLTCHDAHAAESPALLKAPSVRESCQACHPPADGRVAHPLWAQGQCLACHDPHGSDAPAGPRAGGDSTCRACHQPLSDAMDRGSHTHRDVEGGCLACHAAHAGDHPALLAAAPRDGCAACHEAVGSAVRGAVVSHDAVLAGDQCISCHEPHGSERPRMLRDDQAAVCLRCHDKPVVAHDGRTVRAVAGELATAPVVHGAVRLGGCADCHSVHGGGHAQLLRQADPAAFTDPFDARHYALCLACHDAALATDDSPAVTRFRDGDRNLHRAHLAAGERSRGCASCHAAHASTGPRLIAQTVPYEGSGWEMPVGFRVLPEGGSCAPGCHEPMTYSRSAPAGGDRPPQGGAP